MSLRAVVSLLLMCFVVLVPAPAEAQEDQPLALLILRVFGPDGLFVDTNFLQFGHNAHFLSSFQSNFTPFNTAIANELTNLPLPSSASGYTYSFDPDLGVFVRTTQSFGPIYTERAETIGGGKFAFNFSQQFFSFNSIEEFDLAAVPAVFTHEPLPPGVPPFSFVNDIVTTVNAIESNVSMSNFFLTYGLTDFLDVSVAVPLMHTSMSITSTATIHRISGTSPTIHHFVEPGAPLGDVRVYSASDSATGIGDIVVRAKGTAIKGERVWVSFGTDLRLPTGDELELIGTGAWGVRPFAVISWRQSRVSPHINVGYLWNGESVLAGDVQTGVKADLADQFFYSGGVDVGINNRLSLVFDLLGQYVIDAQRIEGEAFTAANGQPFSNIGFRTESYNALSLSLGAKTNLWRDLLFDFNVLLRLDDNGLRDTVTPMFGIEYTF